MAHIHLGAVGVDGDIVLNLSANIVTGNDGVVTIDTTVTDADFMFMGSNNALGALGTGLLYFNLHTALNPGGEIRGQLIEADDAPGDGGPG